MSHLVLDRGLNRKKNNIFNLINQFRVGPYFLLVSLIAFVGMMTVITLAFSAQQVTKGYMMASLESDHKVLQRDTEIKDMQISQVRSLNYIENSPRVQRMVRPHQLVFVNGETAIAKR